MSELIRIAPDLIDPNPYQPGSRLNFTPESLADLESIREQLLQPFSVRYHPAVAGRYQQAYGHRRLAAWKLYRPGEMIPCFVEDLDDQAMFRYMVIENEQRLDTNSIEKALTLQAYIQNFHVTQAEAGQLYGLRTQSAVSNLLRLLKLPVTAQRHVAEGNLPERLARLLVPLVEIDAKFVVDTATKIAKQPEDNRQDTLYHALHRYQHNGKGPWLHWRDIWPPDWPGKPIPISADMFEGTNPPVPEVPACKGCPYLIDFVQGAPRCARPACYWLKHTLWRDHETRRIALKLKIKPLAKGEGKQFVSLVGGRNWETTVKLALKTKHESLRIAPMPNSPRADSSVFGYDWVRAGLLGSEHVILGTLDEAALAKAIKAIAPKEKAAVKAQTQNPYTREHQRRLRQVKEARRLMRAAGPHLAASVIWPRDTATLDLLQPLLRETASRIGLQSFEKFDREWRRATVAERVQILADVIIAKHVPHDSLHTGVDKAGQKIADLAKLLKVRLPAGWNRPAEDKAGKKKRPAKK